MSVRPPAVAGAFYPDDRDELGGMVRGFLDTAKNIKTDGALRALVEPHAGYVYSGPVAAYGYKALAAAREKITRIILLGPSHYAPFFGACEAGYDAWETPLGIVKAESLREKLKGRAKELVGVLPGAHAPEHCLEVQLPFLQSVMKTDFVIYPLLCGEVNPEALADAILDSGILDEKALVIASSDLSHYLPYDIAIGRDRIANETVPALDIKKFQAAGDACGKLPILTLMHIAKKKGWKGKFLDYRNSGDTAGPKTEVVGYGCYAFYEEK